jgi:glycosyltransferase involved in cell wall biosynthesis
MTMTVSVIMPAYNAEKTIAESVRSVLSQTFTDFELIVTDDCSSDGTPDLCEGFAKEDRHVRMLRNTKNMGAAAARNLAINEARGEWIAFLDSDIYNLRFVKTKIFEIKVTEIEEIAHTVALSSLRFACEPLGRKIFRSGFGFAAKNTLRP